MSPTKQLQDLAYIKWTQVRDLVTPSKDTPLHERLIAMCRVSNRQEKEIVHLNGEERERVDEPVDTNVEIINYILRLAELEAPAEIVSWLPNHLSDMKLRKKKDT